MLPAPQETSFRLVVEADRALAIPSGGGDPITIYQDESYGEDQGVFHRLLSRAGPYVSYHIRWYSEGAARPSYGERIQAVKVGPDGIEPADLRDLFDERDIVSALLATPQAQALDLPEPPADLATLLQALQDHYPCEADYLRLPSSFALTALTETTAQVTIGLSHACESSQGSLTQLGLTLPSSPGSHRSLQPHSTFETPALEPAF